MKGKVTYYISQSGENPVKDFIDSLSKQQKAKIFRIFTYIELYGLFTILPHTKKLTGNPLWEIRILGKDNIRILYISLEEDSILALHGFIKKTQRTLVRELNIALNRLKCWIDK